MLGDDTGWVWSPDELLWSVERGVLYLTQGPGLTLHWHCGLERKTKQINEPLQPSKILVCNQTEVIKLFSYSAQL